MTIILVVTGGKSAVLTGIILALGGKSGATGRFSNIKGFIKTGKKWALQNKSWSSFYFSLPITFIFFFMLLCQIVLICVVLRNLLK